MPRALLVCLLACLPLAAQVAPVPSATDLPGSPFSIKKTWFIGGSGDWDYLTMDAAAQQLYIAHGRAVQVVDVNTGNVIAQIPGFREAHSIALDATGAYGYVSDGLAGDIKVLNLATFKIESVIPILCSPRSLAIEPQSGLLFAICGAVAAAPPGGRSSPSGRNPASSGSAHPRGTGPQANISGTSHIVAIDTGKNLPIADMILPGDFQFAQADRDGHVYVTVAAVHEAVTLQGRSQSRIYRQRIANFDAQAIAAEAQRQLDQQPHTASSTPQPVQFDWSFSESTSPNPIPGSLVRFLPLPDSCANPRGLAADGKDERVFVACQDQHLLVLNANSGGVIASLLTGPGDDIIGFDLERGLIYVANGAGYGSLTIIRQDATTDSYAVVQNLPTRTGARTLAVDSVSGDVYLVTDFQGADLATPGGVGTLKMVPVPGSFQVLVIGQ